MKIFISHSTREKWIAKKISEDLLSLGCETFLDEKDISSGSAIDSSINRHLKDADDFLILLSESSLKSSWVLIELGGAIALGKKIIPILLFIGVNDIPDAISKYLARDLNDIQLYYEEVKKQLKGVVVKRRPLVKKIIEEIPLKIGQRVKIIENPDKSTNDGVSWNDDGMSKYIGLIATITEVNPKFNNVVKFNTCKLDIDGNRFFWRRDWIIVLDE